MGGGMPSPEPGPTSEQLPERKRARFWIRAARQTPQEQLAFARQLEADGRTKDAIKQYKALVHNWHESTEAVEAQYARARMLESRGDFEEAFDAYQYMADFFPGRFDHEDLLTKQMSLAAQIRTEKHMRFLFLPGAALPERALPHYEDILENAPEWEDADQAQYQLGRIHQEMEEYAAARDAYERLASRYPASEHRDEAAYRAGQCAYILAQKSPRDEVLCRNALSALSSYVNGHAISQEYIAKANAYMVELKSRLAQLYYDRARFYDRAKHYEAALIAYRDLVKKFPTHAVSDQARERMTTIQSEREQDQNE
jgi:outer membrane assembly lipoprotein YfiO